MHERWSGYARPSIILPQSCARSTALTGITVRIVPSRAVLLLLVAWFPCATDGVMMISSRRCPLACLRIHVLAAELLATFEAPGFATAMIDQEGRVTCRKTTGKNIVAGCILQTPSLAPGALLGIHSTLLLHQHIQGRLHSHIRGARTTHPRTGSYSLLQSD